MTTALEQVAATAGKATRKARDMSTGKMIILCITVMFMALLGVGIAMGSGTTPAAPVPAVTQTPGTSAPTQGYGGDTNTPVGAEDSTVAAYNDGFTEGMQNARDIGPAGVAQWFNAH